jgi:tetratricopeptide (TPR) repeat protein
MTLALLGDLYLRTGKFGQAEDYYRQAIRLIEADPLEFNTRIARLLYSLSVAYQAAGQHADADFSLGEAAAIALNNLNKHDMAAIVEEYSAKLEKEGKTKQASDLRTAVKRSRAAGSLVIDAFGRF